MTNYKQNIIKIIVVFIPFFLGVICYFCGWFNSFDLKIATPIGDFSNTNITDINKNEKNLLNNIGPVYPVLFKMYQEKTSLEKDTFFEKYKNFKFTDKGIIEDIGKNGVVMLGGEYNERHISLVCVFNNKWERRLSIASVGENLEFEGILSQLDNNRTAILKECNIKEIKNGEEN